MPDQVASQAPPRLPSASLIMWESSFCAISSLSATTTSFPAWWIPKLVGILIDGAAI
jgi:hypothetical protein